MKSYVFVHAHPDDETLWTGGLIATLAQRGEQVIVVTCTRGERGEVITAPGTATENLGHLFGDHRALAAYRTSELQAALRALGDGIEHHFLDELPLPPHRCTNREGPPGHSARNEVETQNLIPKYQDSGMVWLVPPSIEGDDPRTSTGGVAGPDPDAAGGFANVNLNESSGRLANYLLTMRGTGDEVRDNYGVVVVTYEADGGYGHPDHVRTHDVAVAALELVRAQPAASGTLELWEVTKPGEPHDANLPIWPVLPQLLTAMRAYASQVQDAREDVAPGRVGWFALSNGVPLPIRDTETYRVTKIK